MLYDGIILSCIIMVALCAIAYLNKYWTNWIKVCHILGYSSKEKPEVILNKIKELQDSIDTDNYAKAKEELGL